MQHSATDALQPRLMHTLGRDPQGFVVLVCPENGRRYRGRCSARLSPTHQTHCIAARCDALVLFAACGGAIVLEFIAGDDAAAAPNIVQCDALHIGQGARIFADGRTLFIRAHHLDVRAQGEQRLRGATISIG